MARTARFYAEHTLTHPLFNSRGRSWQVFDREHRDPIDPNLSAPVCMCVNRVHAFRVRDLMNAAEEG